MRLIGWILIVVIVGAGCVALVFGFATGAQTVAQPIAFNHSIHIEQAGLTCFECHTSATTRVYAGLPGKHICLDCHDIDEEQGAHPEKDKLFAFDEVEGDVPWVRVALTRPDVYFSHRRHVVSGKLDCLVCHVGQSKLEKPPRTAQLVMTMDACIECHEENSASSDCLACHR